MAGTNSGRRWTPFQQTCENLRQFVKAHPGACLKDAIDGISTHYQTKSAARACIKQWAETGKIEGVRIEKEGKYWRGLICNRVKLDLFLCEPDNFGIQYLIRTGSADFSQRIVTALRYRQNCPVSNGYVHDAKGNVIVTPDEQSVFDLLGMTFIEPRERV
jgi:DNA polymerase/3'-5' exonuclease PolX